MPFFNSKNIKAKDIIGWAIELAAVEQARVTIKSIGRTFYNLAVSEIYTILGYIDVEALTQDAEIDVTTPAGNYKAALLHDEGTEEDFINYDKIIALELANVGDFLETLEYIQSFPLPLKEFLEHKSETFTGVPVGASHPYEDSAIYTITGDTLHILWGKNIVIDKPTCKIYFTRQPTILTAANYETAYMDVPDKYAAILANRIAAYAEMREGISEKSMALVQASYQQLLAPLDSQMRAKIMDSFQYRPTFTPTEKKENELYPNNR